jgi:hypothetical protein
VLAERRQASPMPVGRTDAEVLSDYLNWSNWIDAADGGTAP